MNRTGRDSDAQDTAFSLHILSRESGKPALANTATLLARQYKSVQHPVSQDFTATQADINTLLEGIFTLIRLGGICSRPMTGKYGFPGPDLMLIHNILPHKWSRNVLELHGFPPWQIRLTEFQYVFLYPPLLVCTIDTCFSQIYSWNQYPVSSWSRWRLLWQPPYIPLDEVEFRRSLDEFASAEQRLGK